jgi:hypothetical protein
VRYWEDVHRIAVAIEKIAKLLETIDGRLADGRRVLADVEPVGDLFNSVITAQDVRDQLWKIIDESRTHEDLVRRALELAEAGKRPS